LNVFGILCLIARANGWQDRPLLI